MIFFTTLRKIKNTIILIYIIIIVNIVLLNTSFAFQEWTKVAIGNNGHTFFVDMMKIIEKKKYIYFWQLINYIKPDEYGDYSAKIYIQADCKKFKFRWNKVSYHKLFMAKDKVKATIPSKAVEGWQYPRPNTTSFAVLDYVCKNMGVLL